MQRECFTRDVVLLLIFNAACTFVTLNQFFKNIIISPFGGQLGGSYIGNRLLDNVEITEREEGGGFYGES